MSDGARGVLVSVDAHNGIVRRYITIDGPRLMTHEAYVPAPPGGGPIMFNAEVIESFRVAPPEAFRVNHPKPPPTPPAGGTPVQVRIAA